MYGLHLNPDDGSTFFCEVGELLPECMASWPTAVRISNPFITVKISVVWYIMPGSPLKVYRSFGGAYHFHPSGLGLNQERNKRAACAYFNRLHGIISQKTKFLTNTLRTSRPFISLLRELNTWTPRRTSMIQFSFLHPISLISILTWQHVQNLISSDRMIVSLLVLKSYYSLVAL